jgi:hypothetical protein
MVVTKKIKNSNKIEVFRETWSEEKIPRQANWTPTCQTQIHKPNPYSIEEEKESVDGEFQKSKLIDEEFRHEDVEDPSQSQGFVN